MKNWILFSLLILSIKGFSVVETVDHVDLERYMGRWYEIALIPNWFEKKCVSGATADYSLMKNGMVRVVNRCMTSNGPSEVVGVAWVVDKESQSKLKVSFFPLARYFKWFGGDYYILFVDENYTFAVVGSPSLKYLWLLARETTVSSNAYQTFLAVAKKNGYDTEKIMRR